jgi:hypothetical protein
MADLMDVKSLIITATCSGEEERLKEALLLDSQWFTDLSKRIYLREIDRMYEHAKNAAISSNLDPTPWVELEKENLEFFILVYNSLKAKKDEGITMEELERLCSEE